MKISCLQTVIDDEKCQALIVGFFQGAQGLKNLDNAGLQKVFNDFQANKDFKGKLNETALLYHPDGVAADRVVLVGLGQEEKCDLEKARQAAGSAAKMVLKIGVEEISFAVETFQPKNGPLRELTQSVVEGAVLASYQYNKFKSPSEEGTFKINELVCFIQTSEYVEWVQQGLEAGRKTAEAANFSRDLQNHPGNWLTPTRLANIAAEMAQQFGLNCQILNRADMEELKMGALLGVSQGSQEAPRFIVLEHNMDRSDLETLVLVGKGITFDSGGISIKPGDKMEEMKFDMSGGSAVIGAMRAIAELEIPLHVVGLVPASENLPSGSSMKPGDILTASNGKTIEIINTDAEGRLVLADALVYAQRYQPQAVVDLATLTGACVIALGHHASGLLGNDQTLLDKLQRAGEKCGERVWQLPLWENYHDQIKSDYADMKNIGGKPGGAITAAALLENFTDYPWAHLDIAGTAWTSQESAYIPKGGTGVGVLLLVQFLRDWVE
ncbi:MAG: leucyl aminopeptidase [bacterium]